MTQYGSIQSRSDAAFTGQLAFCPQCDHAFVPNNWGSTLQGFTPITMGAGGEPQYGERTWTCPECANDLKAQIPRPKLAQTDEYLTQAEIARLYGVRPSAVTNWRARHQTFPQPAAQGYPWSAIQAWQEGRGNQPVMTMDELRQQRPQQLDIQEPIRDPGFRLNPELPWPEAESDIWRGRRRNVRPPLGFDEFGDFDPPSGSRVAQYHGYDGMWPDAPAQKITSITSITSSPPPQSQHFRRDTLNGDTTHIVTGDNTKADTRVMDITPNGDDRTAEVIKPLTPDLSPWERNLSQPHSLSRRTKTDRLDEPAIGWPWHTNSVSHSPLSSDQSSLRSIGSEGQSSEGFCNPYLRPSFREFPTSWGIRESKDVSVSDFDWAGTKSGIKSMLKHAFSVEGGPSFYYRWLPASIRDQVEQSGMVPNPDTGNSMHFWDNMENAQRYGEIANDIEPHDLWEVTGKPGRLNSDPWFKMVNQPEYGDQPGAWQSDATHIPPDRIKRIGSHNEDSPYDDLFHLAPTAERDRIQAHGLQPSQPSLGTDAFNPQGPGANDVGVYGFPQPDGQWRHYMEETTEQDHDWWRIPHDSIKEAYPDAKNNNAWYVTHPVNAILHQGPEDRMQWPPKIHNPNTDDQWISYDPKFTLDHKWGQHTFSEDTERCLISFATEQWPAEEDIWDKSKLATTRSLYHGTLLDHLDNIKRYGLQPDIGSFTRDAYGVDENDNFNQGDEQYSMDELGFQPTTFMTDKKRLDKALTAIRYNVANKLGVGFHDVTPEHVRNHGLLIKQPGEMGWSDDPRSDNHLQYPYVLDENDTGEPWEDDPKWMEQNRYTEHPYQAEPGDFYSTDPINPSGLQFIHGPAMMRVFQRHLGWPAQENQGTFGKLKEGALDWSQGMWGRGFQDPEGNYHTWPVENLGSGGKPHHGEMAQQMGLESYQNPVIIGPTGWYTHNTNDVTDDVRGFQQPGMRYTPDFDRWDWKSRIAAPLWDNPDVSGAESLHPSNFTPWRKGSWGKGFITPFGRVIHWQTDSPDGQPAHSLGMQAYRWMAPMTTESDEPGFGPFRDEEGYDDPYKRLHPFIISPHGAVSPHFPENMTPALKQKLYNAHPDFYPDNGKAREQYDYNSWGTYSKADVPQWVDVNTYDEPDPDLATRRPMIYDPSVNTTFAGEPGALHGSILGTVMFDHGHNISDNSAFGWIGHHPDGSRSDAVYNRGKPNEVGWYQGPSMGKPSAQAHLLALQKAQEMTRTATSIYEWPEGEGAYVGRRPVIYSPQEDVLHIGPDSASHPELFQQIGQQSPGWRNESELPMGWVGNNPEGRPWDYVFNRGTSKEIGWYGEAPRPPAKVHQMLQEWWKNNQFGSDHPVYATVTTIDDNVT